MRARTEWREEHICPMCGYPREVCQDPATEWALDDPDPIRCHVTTRLFAARAAYAKNPTANPDGLLWVSRFKAPAGPTS